MAVDDLLIVAGEASGDLHGARMLSALRTQREGLRAFGMGGDELREAGFDAVADASEIAVVGITEVLKVLPRARQIFAQLLDEVDRRQARAAVLIDSPEFNLRMARDLHRRGVRVLYYVSPQVWAWRKGRIQQIVRDVDTMLVLFPFETDFYRRHGVDVVHVGHPLVDEVPQLETAWERDPLKEDAADKDVVARVALLPGSRGSEVRSLLPGMLETIRQMAAERPVTARLIQAPTVKPALLDELIARSGIDTTTGVTFERVRHTERYATIADCHLALCASGTATVEVGLLGTPMLVLYRLKWTSYVLGKLLVDLPHFCMVNLVLDERVVPELLQGQTRPDRVARQALDLLADRDAIDAMRQGLARLRPALGSSGASERTAAAVAARLADLESNDG